MALARVLPGGRLAFRVGKKAGPTGPVTGLSVATDPGTPWVWLGSALMVLGMMWALYLRYDAAWCLLARDGALTCRITSHKPGMGEEESLARVQKAFEREEVGGGDR